MGTAAVTESLKKTYLYYNFFALEFDIFLNNWRLWKFFTRDLAFHSNTATSCKNLRDCGCFIAKHHTGTESLPYPAPQQLRLYTQEVQLYSLTVTNLLQHITFKHRSVCDRCCFQTETPLISRGASHSLFLKRGYKLPALIWTRNLKSL